jgi:hypothetical protein
MRWSLSILIVSSSVVCRDSRSFDCSGYAQRIVHPLLPFFFFLGRSDMVEMVR